MVLGESSCPGGSEKAAREDSTAVSIFVDVSIHQVQLYLIIYQIIYWRIESTITTIISIFTFNTIIIKVVILIHVIVFYALAQIPMKKSFQSSLSSAALSSSSLSNSSFALSDFQRVRSRS